MAARSPLITYPVAVKLHPGLSDLQQVGVSSVQRAALAAHGRPGTTQRDPHWRVWTSSSLPSWSPGFSCWSQPRGCSPWQGTPPSRRRLTRSASGIEEIEREALAAYSRLSLVGVRRRGSGDGADIRILPLSMRKASLARLLARRVDGIFLSDFEQGEIGPDIFRHACLLGLEGPGLQAPREQVPRRPVPALDQGEEPVSTASCAAGLRCFDARSDGLDGGGLTLSAAFCP